MLKRSIKGILKLFDLSIASYSELEAYRNDRDHLRNYHHAWSSLGVLQSLSPDQAVEMIKWIAKSKSQFAQDIYALSVANFKRGGYFVEFGAANGIDNSNTYLLEKDFGWQGLLAEPARSFQDMLRKSRSVNLEPCCVWRESGSQITFNETDITELSTIAEFSGSDSHEEKRKNGSVYQVGTISLNDLLDKHKAPKEIDYISMDTEGSEFEILNAFDFSRYSVKVITCEHNFTSNREKIFELLSRHGYERRLTDFSQSDDWYVKKVG